MRNHAQRLIRFTRLLQVIGILVALFGLAGHWLTQDAEQPSLTRTQQELLGMTDDSFHASFVVAGRDIFYGEGNATPEYNSRGEIVCWRSTGSTHTYGTNTDTIMYVSIINDDLDIIMLPRDLFVGSTTRKINVVYDRLGAEGLKQVVSEFLGVPVDYYVIVNLDVFKNIVDALEGVTVNVPSRMYHRDCAAGYTIDLQPGVQRLDGEQASHFARFRDTRRGDIDRIDNVKTLAYAMLARLKELHIRAVTKVPELTSIFFDDVETNATPALVAQLLPRVGGLDIRSSGSLPTFDAARRSSDGTIVHGLDASANDIERFLAATFGGSAQPVSETPDTNLLITNRCGVDGLEDWYHERLARTGTPADLMRTRAEPAAPSASRILTTFEALEPAHYYADLLNVSVQQIDRFTQDNDDVDMELVLGADSAACAPRGFTPAASTVER